MMTPEQAKEILSIARSIRAGSEDPELREARRLADSDPELRRWWEDHQRRDAELRAALGSIPVPPGLAERIVADRPASTLPFPSSRRWLWGLAAAAAAAIVLAACAFWWSRPAAPRFPEFRDRMARAALRDYRMDMRTNDLAAIQRFLAQSQAPADYALSPSLQRLPGLGCGVLRWQSRPVSMICFDRGGGHLVWLFVAEQDAVAGAPTGSEPVFAAVGRLSTATWSQGHLLYLLATVGDRPVLEGHL